MKFAAAYMMAIMAGKEPTRENLEEILNAVGIEWTSQGDELLNNMEGKAIEEILAMGAEKLANVNSFIPDGSGQGKVGSECCVQTEVKDEDEKVEDEDEDMEMPDMFGDMGDDY